MPLDILAPLMIYILLINTFEISRIINWLLFLIFIILIISMKPTHWQRTSWSQSYFDIKLPQNFNFKIKGVVLLPAKGNSMGHLRPSFPPDWHFFSIYNLPYVNKSLKKWSDSGEYQFFILQKKKEPIDIDRVKQMGFNLLDSCWNISNKLDTYVLCSIAPLRKLPSQNRRGI
jgi:hypothetical protein